MLSDSPHLQAAELQQQSTSEESESHSNILIKEIYVLLDKNKLM